MTGMSVSVDDSLESGQDVRGPGAGADLDRFIALISDELQSGVGVGVGQGSLARGERGMEEESQSHVTPSYNHKYRTIKREEKLVSDIMFSNSGIVQEHLAHDALALMAVSHLSASIWHSQSHYTPITL